MMTGDTDEGESMKEKNSRDRSENPESEKEEEKTDGEKKAENLEEEMEILHFTGEFIPEEATEKVKSEIEIEF